MTGLFSNKEADLHSPFAKFNLQTRNTSPSPRGYFAFPPPSAKGDDHIIFARTSDTNEQIHGQARPRYSGNAINQNTHDNEFVEKDAYAMEQDEEERRQADGKRKRLEKEKELATFGEFEWVRSGGVLRDERGRRDKVRTDSVRQEIRLQEREKLLTDRWEIYEGKWHALLKADDPISFKDLPWPVPARPLAVEDLTFAAISDFLLEPLEVRTNTVTKRERIRTSLLRWHPDKMSSILCRVVEDDVDLVREGIGAVLTSLKRMKD